MPDLNKIEQQLDRLVESETPESLNEFLKNNRMGEKTITLKDGRTVYKKDYIKSRTESLVEFGYTNLTEKEVEQQLDKILNGDIDLTVIGLFIESEINKIL